MDITKTTQGVATVYAIDGRLNAPGARQFRETVSEASGRVLVDVADVDYISSAGLRALMEFHRDLAANDGTLVLCNVHPHVHDVLEASGFLSFLVVHEDRESALESMG